MLTRRRFTALVLAVVAGLLVAACGGAEPTAIGATSSAVNGLDPVVGSATAAPAPTALPTPTAVRAPMPTTTPPPATEEPAKFPTPEPWQPAATQPVGAAAPGQEAATESAVDPVPVATSAAVDGRQDAERVTYELGVCLFDLTADKPTPVPCEQPHRVEVYHVGEFPDLPGSPHPGHAMLDQALDHCAPSFEALPGVAQSGESFEVQVHGPSESQWDNGDRFLSCLLVFPELVDQPLTDIDRSVPPAVLGACFTGTDVNSLVPAACQEPHRFQVYATTAGALELEAAEDFCRRALGDESLFVDFNRIWQADVIVGSDQVDCYLSSAEPTTGSVFDDPDE